jgi:hypothetical protein
VIATGKTLKRLGLFECVQDAIIENRVPANGLGPRHGHSGWPETLGAKCVVILGQKSVQASKHIRAFPKTDVLLMLEVVRSEAS